MTGLQYEINAARALEEMGHPSHGIAAALDHINDTLQKVADALLKQQTTSNLHWTLGQPVPAFPEPKVPVSRTYTGRSRGVVLSIINEDLEQLSDAELGEMLVHVENLVYERRERTTDSDGLPREEMGQ